MLWDRSGVGWSPMPHAPVLGAPQMTWIQNFEDLGSSHNQARRSLASSPRPPRPRAASRPLWSESTRLGFGHGRRVRRRRRLFRRRGKSGRSRHGERPPGRLGHHLLLRHARGRGVAPRRRRVDRVRRGARRPVPLRPLRVVVHVVGRAVGVAALLPARRQRARRRLGGGGGGA